MGILHLCVQLMLELIRQHTLFGIVSNVFRKEILLVFFFNFNFLTFVSSLYLFIWFKLSYKIISFVAQILDTKCEKSVISKYLWNIYLWNTCLWNFLQYFNDKAIHLFYFISDNVSLRNSDNFFHSAIFPPGSRVDDSPLFVLCANDTCSFTWTGDEHINQVCC